MKCSSCNKYNIQTNIYDSFKPKYNINLCGKCLFKYLIDLYLEKVPIKNYFIWHFYISNTTVPQELKQTLDQVFRPFYLIEAYYKKTIIVIDDVEDIDFKIIDDLNFGDIIILSYEAFKIE